MVRDRDIVTVAPVTLSDFERYFRCLKSFISHTSVNSAHVNYKMFTHEMKITRGL